MRIVHNVTSVHYYRVQKITARALAAKNPESARNHF